MKNTSELYSFTPHKLLQIENHSDILEFRCPNTNILIWPVVRDVFFQFLLSKIFYKSWINYNLKKKYLYVIINKFFFLKKLFLFINLILNHSFKLKKSKILFVKSTFEEYKFNRIIDHFIKLDNKNYFTFSKSLSKIFFGKTFDKHIYYLHLKFKIINFFCIVKRENFIIAQKLTTLINNYIEKKLGIILTHQELKKLIEINSIHISQINNKFKLINKLVEKICPKIAIVEEASYSHNAILNYALHRQGIHVAEPQHGFVSKGHLNYNYSKLIRNNKEYKLYLPDDFLGYGKWWNSQINLRVKKYSIGNPNYKYLKSIEFREIKKRKKILFISDGLDTKLYINLANNLFNFLKNNYEIYIRPHPIEYKSSWINDKKILQNVKIDNQINIYKSLVDTRCVISEMSTVLYEAINIVPQIFLWKTAKSSFVINCHPFNSFITAEELAYKIINKDKFNFKLKTNQFWQKNWQKNYKLYLNKHIK
jgi:hypothetical protein